MFESKTRVETEPGEMQIVLCWRFMILWHTRCTTSDSVEQQLIDFIRVDIFRRRLEMRVSDDVGVRTLQCLCILREFIGKYDEA